MRVAGGTIRPAGSSWTDCALGIAGTRSLDLHHVDASRRFPLPQLVRRGRSAEAEKRRALLAPQNTGNGSTAGHSYSLALLPVAVDPDEGVLTEGSDPDGPITVQANAVRILHASKATAEPQSPIRVHLILGQTFAIHLRDDKP